MFIRTVETKGETYVRIVENLYINGKHTQRTIANLGNLKLQKENLIKIIYGLKKLVHEQLYSPDEIDPEAGLEYGSIYVAEKLWEEVGLKNMLEKYFSKGAKTAKEIYAKVMVLNRLSEPKSKLGIFRWLENVWIDGLEFKKELTKEESKKLVEIFYKTLDYIEKFKEKLEKELYYNIRNLFSLKVDIVFYDLTSTYFEGEGPEEIAKLGKSRDSKSRNKQIIIGLIMCAGLPIGHHIFEGNRADKKTVEEVVEDLRARFEINRCIFVGDRGIVSKKVIEFLEDKEYEYIVALRRRRSLETAKAIEIELTEADRIAEFSKEATITNPDKEENFYAKEVGGADAVGADEWGLASKEGRRLILCLNSKRAKEEAIKRAEKIAKVKEELEELAESVKNGNRVTEKPITERATRILSHHNGSRYFRYRVSGKGKFSFEENEEKLEYEKKLDGKFVLLTNNKLFPVKEIVKTYKELSEIEMAFKELKDFLRIRPIYHYREKRVRSHVVICVWAYLLEKILEQKLKGAQLDISAREALKSLGKIRMIPTKLAGKQFLYTTKLDWKNSKILKAVGLSDPPRLIEVKNH
ncbi:MAG: IS1634 family transposase [Actinobacteria bacterium]|nr:IS1634 family transposase [Actinomycetota bacterium]